MKEGRGVLKILTGKTTRKTASLVCGSACLTTNHEVAGSITGISTILNVV